MTLTIINFQSIVRISKSERIEFRLIFLLVDENMTFFKVVMIYCNVARYNLTILFIMISISCKK